MHWFMHARRGVLLFTSRFNSPIAAAAHDMRRRFRCTFNAPPLQVELAIRFCEVIFGHDYASLMNKAAEIALSDERKASRAG